MVQKGTELLHAVSRFQVKIDSRMNAALPEMPVKRAHVAVFVEKLFKIAQIRANLVRWHGGIFPPLPVRRFTRYLGRRAQTGLTDFPKLFLLGLIVE